MGVSAPLCLELDMELCPHPSSQLPPPLPSPVLPLPAPTSEALVEVTGRLNRALGISNLGGYYTGMFTERQLPRK